VSLREAVELVKANAAARAARSDPRDRLSGRPRSGTLFDESLELVLHTALNPKKGGEQVVRGSVLLPHGTGKEVRVAVFASGPDAALAKELGADVVGDEALISEIISSEGRAITFDRLIATPEFMKPLARAGKVLGPRGLMPNPKLGTLTSDVARALREMRQGRLDYRVDREGNLHAALGKVSFPTDALLSNIAVYLAALVESRPKALGGQGLEGYLRRVVMKSSMTRPVGVSLESCNEVVSRHRAAAAAAGAAEAGAQGAAPAAAAGKAGAAGGA